MNAIDRTSILDSWNGLLRQSAIDESEFVESIRLSADITRQQAYLALKAFVRHSADALADGEVVRIRGFGTFRVISPSNAGEPVAGAPTINGGASNSVYRDKQILFVPASALEDALN